MQHIERGPFGLERLGVVMSPQPGDPAEVGGVLNPGSCRGRDGNVYLYPRLVATGNYSRIGIARVVFEHERPVAVERIGYVLEPTEGFERNERTAGVEDPRVSWVPALDHYVMTYVAYGPLGPRVALAVSYDGVSWERIGLAKFGYEPRYATDFDMYVNKDACLFPEPVTDPAGRPALVMMHRPDYAASWWLGTEASHVQPRGVAERRPGIWLSYAPLEAVRADLRQLQFWYGHHFLAGPEQPWEQLKIGGGTPPVRTPLGWLTLFHGVAGSLRAGLDHQPDVRYSAGALLLDLADPRCVLFRSSQPILAPDTADEQHGVVDNVVFPTAIEWSGPDQLDVFYGMADARIGVARMRLPPSLPRSG